MNSTNESIHIRKIVLIFVFFICVFMVSYNFSEKEEPIKKIGNGYHDLVGSTSHARISILGDGALAAFPNKTGSGSALDPFVIENLEICGSNTGECIFISGISLYYLVIKNCTVWGSSPTFPASGIHLLDSRNVKIINCTSRFNGIGITIEGSRNNEITGCSISNNAYDGIWVMWDMSFHSDYNLIADNQIFNNTR
ncbi:MAG: right-handed parallel beta-helix repeat-containing protein, partial [Candidatus Lokiarchaeota archaeon]|nr:right-handed parallel beta-helix repeat-containing protein [Candidatus Lokiarchaeota archaeon]